MKYRIYITLFSLLILFNGFARNNPSTTIDSMDVVIDEYVKNGKNNLNRLIENNNRNKLNNAVELNNYVFTLVADPTGDYSKDYSTGNQVADINALNIKLRVINGELRTNNLPEIYIGVDGTLGNAIFVNRISEVGQPGNMYDRVDKKTKDLGGVPAIINKYNAIYNQITTDINLQPNNGKGVLVISMGLHKALQPKSGVTLKPEDDFSDLSKIEKKTYTISNYYDLAWNPTVPNAKETLRTDVYSNGFSPFPNSTSKTDITTKLQLFAEQLQKGLKNEIVPTPVTCPISLSDLVANTASKRGAEFSQSVTETARLVDEQRTHYLSSDNNSFIDKSKYLKYELPEKLQLLASSDEVSDYELHVVFHRVNFGLADGSGTQSGDDFAQQVFNSSYLKTKPKSILIVVPYVVTFCTPTEVGLTFSNGNAAYMMPHVAAGADVSFVGTIKSLLLTRQGIANVEDCFNAIYKEIPKRYIRIEYTQRFDGSVIFNSGQLYEKTNTAHNRTHIKIVDLVIAKDIAGLDLFKTAQDAYRLCLSSPTGGGYSFCTNQYAASLATIRGRSPESKGFTKNYLNERLLYNDIKNKNFAFIRQYVLHSALRDKAWLGSLINEPSNTYFYGGTTPWAVENALIAIDVASGALSFVGLDVLADGWGAYYAYKNGLYVEAAFYSAAVAIPAVSGGLLRISKIHIPNIKSNIDNILFKSDGEPVYVAGAVSGRIFPNPTKGNFLEAKSVPATMEKINLHATDAGYIKAIEDGYIADVNNLTQLNANPTWADEYFTYRNNNSNASLSKYIATKLSRIFIDDLYKPTAQWFTDNGLALTGNFFKKGSVEIAEVTPAGAIKFKTGQYDPNINLDGSSIFDNGDDVVALAPDGYTQIKGGFGLNPTTGKCYGGNCFIAGTPIHTTAGDIKPIEKIKIGDSVLSKSAITGETTYKQVIKLFRKETKQIVKVFVAGETIITTPEHPFRVGNRWVLADKLQKGDELNLPTNQLVATNAPFLARSSIEVDSIARLDSTATVYNFEVEGFHTYYVGKSGYWVHNLCSPNNVRTLANNGSNAAKTFLGNISDIGDIAKRLNIYKALDNLTASQQLIFIQDFNYAISKGINDDILHVFGGTNSINASNEWKILINSGKTQEQRLIGTIGKYGDFVQYDISGAINHVKYRIIDNPNKLPIEPYKRNEGIVGSHDRTVFFAIPHFDNTVSTSWSIPGPPSGPPIYIDTNNPITTPLGVPHFVITRRITHPTLPGIERIEFKLPQLSGDNKTLGGQYLSKFFQKTVYDPAIYDDFTLEKLLKESIVSKKISNNGVLAVGQNIAPTADNISMQFFIRNGVVDTFFFDF